MQIFPPIEGPFDAFVAPARPRAELWRLILSMVLIGISFIVGAMGASALFYLIFGAPAMRMVTHPETFGTTPLGIIFLLSNFIFVFLLSWLVVRLLHGRGAGTVFGGPPGRLVRNGLIAAAILTFLTGLGALYAIVAVEVRPNLPPEVWLGFMVIVLPLLLIQVTAEEFIFRGFLQQQLAARFASPWVWMVLPSVIFGLLHYQPAMLGPNAWIAVVITTLVGIFAADVTARTGNLGAAIGLHFVNNFFAMCFISLSGAMSGVSLFVTPYTATDHDRLRSLLLVDAGSIVLIYGIYVAIMNRKRRA